MLKKKIKLCCYKISGLFKRDTVVLPWFLNKALYTYNGRKRSLFVITSPYMFFLSLSMFVLSKKRGSIHRKKETIRGKKKR